MIGLLKRLFRATLFRMGYVLVKREASSPAGDTVAVDDRDHSVPTAVASRADDIVAAAKKNLASSIAQEPSAALPPYGTRWQPQAAAIRAAIETLTDATQCLHFAQTRITFDHRESGGFVQDLARIQLYDDLVRHEFPWFGEALDAMGDNPLSVKDSLVMHGSRYVSNIFYWHVRYVLACMTYMQPPKRVLEIGGGYGAPARLWMTNPINAISSYVIVDIPECLFFAEVALRQEFGDAVGYFDGRDPGTPIVLVPVGRLSSFRRDHDLVVNTGSLQEMTDDWVDFYMAWLDGYSAKYFYSVNYAAQPLSLMAESRNLWSPRPGPNWTTRRLCIDVPLIRAQGPKNDFLEALYKRAPTSGSLKDWSVYRGHVLSRATYIEGLDLLRQNLNAPDALGFLDRVLRELRYVPKEALWIVDWLERLGVPEAKPLRQRLASIRGGETHPYGEPA